MRVQRVVLAGLPALAVFAFLHACSSGDSAVTANDAAVPDGGASDAVVSDVIVREAAAPPPGYDGGLGLGLADVADTACSPRGGALATVLAAADGSAPPSFKNLRVVGGRRAADNTDGSSVLFFDADGKNAKLVTPPIANLGTTVLGGQLLAAGAAAEFSGAQVQPYDANGDAVGGLVDIAETNEDPESLAAGADETSALFAWVPEKTFKVRARGFAAGAAAGTAPYDLALGNYPYKPSVAVAPVQANLFAVAFNGFDNGDRWMTGFGRGSSTARVDDPSNLFTGEVARSIVGMVHTAKNLALLVEVADGANPYAMLVTLDVGGHRTSAGLKLLGTSGASAIAVSADGNTIGVLAKRRDASGIAMEFRPFGLDGTPAGSWVCLDAPGVEDDLGGGLVADGTGWSAIFRAKDGSTSLARFDHLGTGAP